MALSNFSPSSLSRTSSLIPNIHSAQAFASVYLPSLSGSLQELNPFSKAIPVSLSETFSTAAVPMGVPDAESLDHGYLLQEIWQNKEFSSNLFNWISRHFSSSASNPSPFYVPQLEPFPISAMVASRELEAAERGVSPSQSPPPNPEYQYSFAIEQLRQLTQQSHPYAKVRCLASAIDSISTELLEDSDAFKNALSHVIALADVPHFRAELEILRYFVLNQNQPVAAFLEAYHHTSS